MSEEAQAASIGRLMIDAIRAAALLKDLSAKKAQLGL